MQRVLIPMERLKLMKRDGSIAEQIEKCCRCNVSVGDDGVEVSGDPLGEFSASNIAFAFGRGFDIGTACMLAHEDFYFSLIDLEQYFGSENRIHQVKARIIGENGKVKMTIERVSNAKMSVYGNTVCFIGTHEGISEAKAAVDALIAGESHRNAYRKMEATHRKNRELSRGLLNK
ncbi:MAG: KH domain-containing protein [Candidatus Micrarchaeia archaeon]